MSDDYPRPSLTADVVLLRYHGGRLQVLLIERRRDPFAGHWALPGGFVDAGETPQAGAARELREETGVTDVPLFEIGVFGAPGRDPRGWVVSSAWLGLAPPDCWAEAGDDAQAARWFALTDLPPLAFDHAEVLSAGRARLRELTQLGTEPLQLLGATFRSAQGRHLYKQIHGERRLDPGTFRAFLRRRQAIERVGPSRYRRKPAFDAHWWE